MNRGVLFSAAKERSKYDLEIRPVLREKTEWPISTSVTELLHQTEQVT